MHYLCILLPECSARLRFAPVYSCGGNGLKWQQLPRQTQKVDTARRRCEKFQTRPVTYNLKFDGLSIEFYGSYFEVHTNRANVTFCVRVVLQRRRDVKETGLCRGIAVKRWLEWLWGNLRHMVLSRQHFDVSSDEHTREHTVLAFH